MQPLMSPSSIHRKYKNRYISHAQMYVKGQIITYVCTRPNKYLCINMKTSISITSMPCAHGNAINGLLERMFIVCEALHSLYKGKTHVTNIRHLLMYNTYLPILPLLNALSDCYCRMGDLWLMKCIYHMQNWILL